MDKTQFFHHPGRMHKLKQSTRFVIICVLLTWLPLILFGVFIFVGHGFEPIIFALHHPGRMHMHTSQRQHLNVFHSP